MGLEVTAEVDEITTVRNEDGANVPARSDDYRHVFGAVDASGDGHSETLRAPDRARSMTLHVDGWTSPGSVAVHFLDPETNARLTTRDETDNAAFGTDGSSDIFVDVAIASPLVEIVVIGSETVQLNGYLR